MSDIKPDWALTTDTIEVRFPQRRQGLIASIFKRSGPWSFTELAQEDRDLLFAIGDLRAWDDVHPGDVRVEADRILMSHDAAASLSGASAGSLGLPRTVDLTLATDVTGVLGRPDFRLHYEWSRHGRRETATRDGAILRTSDGPRRLPLWMKRALDLADGFDADLPTEDHWRALAEFRRALEPEESNADTLSNHPEVAALSMTAFLRGLRVNIADRFSISPNRTLNQFEVVPYSAERLAEAGVTSDEISESDAVLNGETLAVFQARLLQRGPRPAYQLGNNAYLVIDQGIAPVLAELARAQKAPIEERRDFIGNPRAFISAAVERHLRAQGAFDGVGPAAEEEMVEAIAGPVLIESREYSERVTGVTVYIKPPVTIEGSGTTWLPEVFAAEIAAAIRAMPDDALQSLRTRVAEELQKETAAPVEIAGTPVEPTVARLAALDGEIERRAQDTEPEVDDTGPDEQDGPVILDTMDNYADLEWQAKLAPREATIPVALPSSIRTALHVHQVESFDWATSAWQAGLPGILNADEQGLGKTLQTIAFLTWLKAHMAEKNAKTRAPVLIVAPTSLLRNWEQEVETHVEGRGFGTLIRLYGSGISAQKRRDASGTETQGGLPQLDLEWLDDAFEEGRAHRYWFLTTYTTMTNYQHSLGRVRFAAMVMDEIQNIKNRTTLAAKAAEAMNADFRIGLTGTPIENATIDLWTIMDRIAAGSLGAGSEFSRRYAEPTAENMAELHGRVFLPQGRMPPLALRRLKDEVARDLPAKRRLLHPRIMPQIQADTYDLAQAKLANKGPGAALKVLHHIRSVSVHPGLRAGGANDPERFIGQSARLTAAMAILDRIAAARDRALVFIEDRQMQFRFAEIARHRYGLERLDVINGSTPIPRRQEIVNRFQQHLTRDSGFDVLVLGPRAAGTGLTLTAATHVIHLSRWWNPAVEEQCNDRVHRIGQTREVSVHVPMAIHPALGVRSFDCLLQSLMQRKRRLAQKALWPMGDTKADVSGLVHELSDTAGRPGRSGIDEVIAELFDRDGLPLSRAEAEGAYNLP